MKKIVFLVTFIVTVASLKAQEEYKKFAVGLGLNSAFPMGDIKNTMPIGRGLNAQMAYRLNSLSEISFQLNSDYFPPKNVLSSSLLCLNGLIGGRYHIIPKYLVAGLGIGYGYITDEEESKYNVGGLAISPEVGMSTRKLQFMVHYTSISTSKLKAGMIGIRTVYFF